MELTECRSFNMTMRALHLSRLLCQDWEKNLHCMFYGNSKCDSTDEARATWSARSQEESSRGAMWVHVKVPVDDRILGGAATRCVTYAPGKDPVDWSDEPDGQLLDPARRQPTEAAPNETTEKAAAYFVAKSKFLREPDDCVKVLKLLKSGSQEQRSKVHVMLVRDRKDYEALRVQWNVQMLGRPSHKWFVADVQKCPALRRQFDVSAPAIVNVSDCTSGPLSSLILSDEAKYIPAMREVAHKRTLMVLFHAPGNACTRDWNRTVAQSVDSSDTAWLAISSEDPRAAQAIEEYQVQEFPTVLEMSRDQVTPMTHKAWVAPLPRSA